MKCRQLLFMSCLLITGCGDLSAINGTTNDPSLGRVHWLTEEESVCPAPGAKLCKKRKTGSFVADRKIKYLNNDYCHIRFSDGEEGFIFCTTVDFAPTEDPQVSQKRADNECRKRGQPRIGMTEEQAFATCWGKPYKVNRSQNGSHSFDQYVFMGNRYMYFSDGRLTSVQESNFVGR